MTRGGEINVMIWFRSQSTTTNNNKISAPDSQTLWLINHGNSPPSPPHVPAWLPSLATLPNLYPFSTHCFWWWYPNIYCSRSVPIKSQAPKLLIWKYRRPGSQVRRWWGDQAGSNYHNPVVRMGQNKRSRELGRNGGSVGRNIGCQRFIRSIHQHASPWTTTTRQRSTSEISRKEFLDH